VIAERMPQSSGLLVVPRRNLGEKLAPQARQVFWSLRSPEVAGIVDKVSGTTCRSAGLLTSRVHLTGTSVTLVGGDPRVPMSLKPRSTCRRRAETMSC
jgi:hypothetical protein